MAGQGPLFAAMAYVFGKLPRVAPWLVFLVIGSAIAIGQCATVASPREQAALHNHAGIELAKSGNHVEAVKEFRAATLLDPRDATAYYNLGLSLSELGDGAGAIESFRSAARLKP